MPDLLSRFISADRLLLHWQTVAGVGRPGRWASLPYTGENVPVLRARIEEARARFFGTEQMHGLDALSEELRCLHAPAPPPETERAPGPAPAESPRAALVHLETSGAHEYEYAEDFLTPLAEGEGEPAPEE